MRRKRQTAARRARAPAAAGAPGGDPAVGAEVGKRCAESRAPLFAERLRALRTRGLVARGADIGALAHALATLSFGIAFMDQVVFGADRRRLREVIAGVARTIAAGL